VGAASRVERLHTFSHYKPEDLDPASKIDFSL
jgi:hypothetical protein